MEFERNPTLDALCARKSVRVFTEEPVPQAVKNALFQAAMQAPTAGNQMLYTILDITDAALKARLADLCDHQPFIADAPVVLVFVADCQRWYDGFAAAGCAPRPPREGDLLLAAADAAIAAQNTVVAAEGRADVDYAARMQAFCARKYNSVFSREMSRSAAVYLRAFSAQCTPGTEEGNARGVQRTENSHAGTD